MKKNILLILLSVILIFAVPIDLRAQRKDTRIILDEIEKMFNLLQVMEKKLAVFSAEFSILQKRMEVVEERLNSLSMSQADMGQNRESTLLTLQYLREELNDMKNLIMSINEKITFQQEQIASENGQQQAGDQQAAPITTPRDPSAVYYAAYSDYLKGNYSLAIQGFQQFIDAFPQSGLADNAYYWIGECHYAQKKFAEAAQVFDELMRKYPAGDKYPAAALKKAFALLAIGRHNDGVNLLKEVISRFPLSEEASLAQQKLQEMNE